MRRTFKTSKHLQNNAKFSMTHDIQFSYHCPPTQYILHTLAVQKCIFEGTSTDLVVLLHVTDCFIKAVWSKSVKHFYNYFNMQKEPSELHHN